MQTPQPQFYFFFLNRNNKNLCSEYSRWPDNINNENNVKGYCKLLNKKLYL